MPAADTKPDAPNGPPPSSNGQRIFGLVFWSTLAVANLALFALVTWPFSLFAGLISITHALACVLGPARPTEIPTATKRLDAAMIDLVDADVATVMSDPGIWFAANCQSSRSGPRVVANTNFIDSLDDEQLRGVAAVMHGQTHANGFKTSSKRALVPMCFAWLAIVAAMFAFMPSSKSHPGLEPLAYFASLWPIILFLGRLVGCTYITFPWLRKQLEAGDQIGIDLADKQAVVGALEAMRDWQAKYEAELTPRWRIGRRMAMPVLPRFWLAERADALRAT